MSSVDSLASVAEAYVSTSFRKDNLDSIALYQNHGETWVITTAKATNVLSVFDLNTGALLRKIGGTGSQPGKLMRPNGVWVHQNLMLVVERDNARVQAFQLPDFQPMGFLGEGELVKPYGLTCYPTTHGEFSLYVTDDFEHGSELTADKRVKSIGFKVENGAVKQTRLSTFGALSGPGQLHKVESILADPEHNRLFIADEKGPSVGVKIYDIEGVFTGLTLDTKSFAAEPEGLAIYETGPKTGYLIATDQQRRFTVFHIYDRETLKHLVAFRGAKTANTDGIAVWNQTSERFPIGGLWAIHDDQALAAFDWQVLAKLLD